MALENVYMCMDAMIFFPYCYSFSTIFPGGWSREHKNIREDRIGKNCLLSINFLCSLRFGVVSISSSLFYHLLKVYLYFINYLNSTFLKTKNFLFFMLLENSKILCLFCCDWMKGNFEHLWPRNSQKESKVAKCP